MRVLTFLLLTSIGVTVATPAQEHPTAAEHKRGNRQRATHAPRPELPPRQVLDHLRQGNAAAAAARAARKPLPAPRPRPAGAGRYLCAVLVCADADLDVSALLGIPRRDVLLLSAPGPFVQPEAVALLEHYVATERLSLAVILSHPRCATTRLPSGKTPRQSAVFERVAKVRQRARQQRCSLPRALARSQCELLLASSELLQHSVAGDHLRILPAEVDGKTLKVTWHTTRADELPMPPVK